MSANAIPAQGTVLKIGSGSPLAYKAIAEINSFNGPGGSAQVIDVTDLSSSAKEKRMGLHDNGQLSFECNFIPGDTEHEGLMTAKAAGTLTAFQLVFADTGNTTWSFNAYVLSVAISAAVDGVVKASVTLEISGDITTS
jgi:hypothetical protein